MPSETLQRHKFNSTGVEDLLSKGIQVLVDFNEVGTLPMAPFGHFYPANHIILVHPSLETLAVASIIEQ